MLRIEDRKFQGIDHTADGIDDAAGKEPSEACAGQTMEDRNKSKYTQPAHSNVDHRGKPFRAVDPAALEDHSDDGNSPYEGTEDIAGASVENDQAYRSVAAGNHHEDHHMIHFFQTADEMIRFLEHMDQCDFCLDELLQNEDAASEYAPSYLKDEILKKAASPEVQASRKIHETAYWMKLLCAGLRTAVGMGVALIMLFSVSQTDFTALHPSPETKVKISSSLDIGSGLNQLSREVGSQLSEHSQKISNNLNDLTNKIINGGK